jgi:hypothetical protein
MGGSTCLHIYPMEHGLGDRLSYDVSGQLVSRGGIAVQDPRVQSVALLAVGQASPELERAWQEDLFLQENPELLQVARLVASLEREFLRGGQLDQVPGVLGVQYGFLDPGSDQFGVVIYASPRIRHERSDLEPIPVGDQKFSVVIRRWYSMPASRPAIGPYGALPTCWARSGKYASGQNVGILTALHTVFHNNFNVVLLAPPGTGKLLDEATGGIDAAFIDVGTSPVLTNAITVQANVTPGMLVQFIDQGNNVHHAKVLTVARADAMSSPYRQCTFMSDNYGRSGDSGALVTERGTGNGMGIYTGVTVDPESGNTVGECQHLGQVAKVLNLDLYES